ncbi:MAG: CehA/McbA family metallohydrolase [Candidatus Methanomethylophilaceae archaeon]
MKADLHVHSTFSTDSRSRPEDIIRAAVSMGLGCVAITDHNSFAAYEQVKDNGEIIVIPGEEVSSKEGHILALGISMHIPRDMGVEETIDAIHDAGGVAFAAHPYRWWSGIGEENIVDSFDGIEALNGRSTKSGNRKSLALSERVGKPITSGSDAHSTRRIGTSYVEVSDECRTWQDVIREIMDKNAVPHSLNRKMSSTLRYGFKAITEWIRRGFRRM